MTNNTADYTLVINNIDSISAPKCSRDELKSIIYTKNTVNIIMLNICNIKKHFDKLCNILDHINTQFEVNVLTET